MRNKSWGQSKPNVGWGVNDNVAADLGFVSNFLFNEAGGLTYFDLFNNNRASTVGGVNWTGGQWGHALKFNGTSGYLTTAVPITTLPVTIRAWVYPTTISQFNAIIESRDGGNFTGLLVSGFSGSPANPLTACWSGSATEYNAATGLAFTLNAWQYCAMVVTTSGWNVYWGLAGTGSLSSFNLSSAMAAETLTNWSIGNDTGAGGRFWVGSIDNVGIATAAWNIDQLYKDFLDPFYYMQQPTSRSFLSPPSFTWQQLDSGQYDPVAPKRTVTPY